MIIADAGQRPAPSRHHSRTLALKILFDADVRGESPEVALDRILGDARALRLLEDTDPSADAETDAAVATADRLAERRAELDAEAVDPETRLDEFTKELVRGVSSFLVEIDELLAEHAHRWRVARMPAIDRTILRIATFELLHLDTPQAVVIDEALELAKELSTDKSSGFINGVLEAVRKRA